MQIARRAFEQNATTKQNSLGTFAMLNWNDIAVRFLTFSSILVIADSAVAQVPAAPPVRELVDANGVDLMTGRMTSVYRGPSIGPGGRFGFTRHFLGAGIWDSYVGAITCDSQRCSVIMENTTEVFLWWPVTGVFTPVEESGATLTASAVNGTMPAGTHTYTTASGTVAIFEPTTADYSYPSNSHALLSTVTHPNGERISIEYGQTTGTACNPLYTDSCPLVEATAARVKSLTSNRGYKLSVTYGENSFIEAFDFFLPIQVVVSNLVDGSVVGSVSMSYVEALVDAYWMELQDSLGRVTKYLFDTEGVKRIRMPGSTVDDVTAFISSSTGRVWSVDINGQVTNYAYSDDTSSLPHIRTTTVTRAGGGVRVITSDITNGRLLSDRDELNRTTTYEYDGEGRLSRVTAPDGDFVQYTYDARGNITQTLLRAKPGSGLADIVTSADFDATCTNRKTCNQPNWTRDAKGNQTDYTYDSAHGGVLTMTLPAPEAGAVRPQTRYGYMALEARYQNSSGVLAPSGQPIHMLTSVSTCRTLSACTGGTDESKTVIGYGPTGVGNNLWPVTATSSDGSGALVSGTTLAYDRAGNVLTINGPLAGASDTARMHYDSLRRSVGLVGPDPDGSGLRKPVATRKTYNTAGHLVSLEKGTVNGQSDADWASFVPFETISFDHDAAGRRTKSSLSAGGTVHAVEQASYDALGRSECVATRMNPAVFGSLPASACTLGTTGSFGPDRIAKFTYNAADEVTSVTEAFGTTNAIDTTRTTYTANGRLRTLADGAGNLTTFEYDGFDRLVKIRYPNPNTPGSSSTTDFERRTYDANSNVTSVRTRDEQVIGISPDSLNRIALKDLPGAEDVYFSYDNQNRMLTATYDSQTGPGVVHTYDGLGRLDTRTVFGRTLGYKYDAAGRRTRVIHPDGFYVEYWFNPAGELTSITDSTGTTLASYNYDALGRRDGIDRASGASTALGYDPVSRLDTLTQNLSGTAYDSTTTFTHTPSAQIATRTQSNDAAYAWLPVANSSVDMLPNGLNQVTQVDSTAVGHDQLGNLEIGEGAFTYGYDIENRLRSAVAGTTAISLSYDPLGVLNAVTSNGATTEFLYDGLDLVAEYDSSGAVVRRYVHGAGVDDPLVWYEGSGTTDRRYFHADERGSIVAISDNSGAGIESFKYSPDGEAANAANSRFGYTGQLWLAEVDLYYYKSRMYSPRLGRFLQPDGIGYAGGMNLYAYVGGDPINRIDPLGFQQEDIEEIRVTGRAPPSYDIFLLDLYLMDLASEIDRLLAEAERREAQEQQAQRQCAVSSPDRSIGDSLTDAIVGFGDAFLIPILVRDLFNISGSVDYESPSYTGGMVVGALWGTSTIAVRGAATFGGTRFGHALNHNPSMRIGPGRMPAAGRGLPSGTHVPRVSFGQPGGLHVDLRSRLPHLPPAGTVVGGNDGCN